MVPNVPSFSTTSHLQELLQLPPLRQRKGAPNGVGLGKGQGDTTRTP